ncbi:unnamed protein product [Didymodactylos carnosus]|uniref:Uncharacterized protein n=1 Tax=Didymodactylos carnosus TaxID=1234261 RepID=A0A8S2EQH6_9BILA|nr:unnamed protein product [Didymodactylos carnosus]CAF4018423.1 unnamed protein product [Didymodactylos carnosus]
MFEFQQYLLRHFKIEQNIPSNTSIMTNSSDYIIHDRLHLPVVRERSLSPDSLERNKTTPSIIHRYDATSADEDSLDENDMDHCSGSKYSRKTNNNVRDILKTLTSRGFIDTYSTSMIATTSTNGNNHHQQSSNTIDWDFNDEINADSIHVDNDDLSDGGDYVNGNIDSGYGILDGYEEDVDFQFVSNTTAVTPVPTKSPSSHYNRLHHLDTISEVASEEERRAAKSLKYQHNATISTTISTSSTTVDDDLSTLSDASPSMDYSEQEIVPAQQAINVLNELLNSCNKNTMNNNKLRSFDIETTKQLNDEPTRRKRRFIENHILLNNNNNLSLTKTEHRQVSCKYYFKKY